MRSPAPRPSALLISLLVTVTLLAACGSNDPVSRGSVAVFDSRMDITLIGVDRERAAEITAILERDLVAMERSWHAWKPGPVSYVNARFNESSEAFAAPPSLLPLLRLSKELSHRSEGLFNPAIGHLVRAWGFQGRPASCLRPPPRDLVETALQAAPGMHQIAIDGVLASSSNQVVKLDFRDVQEGFAIDQAIARLQEMGISNASISTDGNLRAIGSRDGHPWSVPVRGPGGGGILATLKILGNEAAFTADVHRRTFAWEGETYHDRIDPRTGYPAVGTASVTVLHPNASTADAAASALFVAGPDDWHRIAKLMGIRYVMLTDEQGRVHMNPAMHARVKLHSRDREVVISAPLS